jgi:hypothetical protein
MSWAVVKTEYELLSSVPRLRMVGREGERRGGQGKVVVGEVGGKEGKIWEGKYGREVNKMEESE